MKTKTPSAIVVFDESYEALGTWQKIICTRGSTESKSKTKDAYVVTPDKKKLRSSFELLNYLSENPKYWPVINPNQINFDKNQTESLTPNTKRIIKFLEEVNKGIDSETVLSSLKVPLKVKKSDFKSKTINCDFENKCVF